MDRFAPGRESGEGYRRFQALSAHLHDDLGAVLLLEAGRGSVRHHRHPGQPQPRPPCATCCPCAWARRSPSTIRAKVKDDAPGADARPFHAVCRLLALRLAGGALRHRPHAGRRRRLVSDGRHPRRGGGAGEARDRARRRRSGRQRTWRSLVIENGAVTGLVTAGGETARLRQRDLQHGFHAHLPGARRRRGRASTTRSKDFEPACSGVVLYLGLNRRYDHLAPPRLRLLPRPGGGVRLHLPPRRAGARSDLLPRGPRRHRPERRAGGRRGALRAGAHALPAPAPRLVSRCSRPTAGRSSTS